MSAHTGQGRQAQEMAKEAGIRAGLAVLWLMHWLPLPVPLIDRSPTCVPPAPDRPVMLPVWVVLPAPSKATVKCSARP